MIDCLQKHEFEKPVKCDIANYWPGMHNTEWMGTVFDSIAVCMSKTKEKLIHV